MSSQKLTHQVRAFGGLCRIKIGATDGDDDEILGMAEEELKRLDLKFNALAPDSIISSINLRAGSGEPTPLDAECLGLLKFANALWDQTHHVFDPSIRTLSKLYRAGIPEPSQRLDACELVDWSQLLLNDEGALLAQACMQIDLNSCVRPYALDSIKRLLVKNGVSSAEIEMHNDVATLGRQPDGANWLVGLKHPQGNRTGIKRIKLNDRGFALRGAFDDSLQLQGERFGKAISPIDGQPIPGLLSVAVVAESCLEACSAATVARFKTEQAGLKWLESLGLPWLAIDRDLACHGPLAVS